MPVSQSRAAHECMKKGMEVMKCLVVYMSRYGSTKRYAEQIAKVLNCRVCAHNEVTDTLLAESQIMILGTCILEGRLEGASVYQEWIEAWPDKSWILYTVGLSNPALTNFDPLMAAAFKPEVLERITEFHFRGTIVYKRLDFRQRIAKQLEDSKEHSLDTVSLGDVERSMLETYGTTYDLTEESSLEPLVARVRAIQKGEK